MSRESFIKSAEYLAQQMEEIGGSDRLSSDLKRENANIDGATPMGQILQFGSALSKQYSNNYLIDERFVEAHQNGDFHIHDADFYASGTATCTQIDLAKLFKNGFSTGHGHLRPPKGIMSHAALAAIALQSNQSQNHGGQALAFLCHDMAPGVLQTFKKEILKRINDWLEYEDSGALKITSDNLHYINSIKLSNVDMVMLKTQTKIPSEILEKIIKQVYKETERQTYQAMEGLIHNFNTMNSRHGGCFGHQSAEMCFSQSGNIGG